MAIGDACGVPFEFKDRGSYLASDMTGYGTYNLPAGTWSDDTSMTIATCDSIRECGLININDIAEKFLSWLDEGTYTPFGDTFDVGNTTYDALLSFSKTHDAHTSGKSGIRDNGNGSLMRIIPIAFLDVKDKDIDEVSGITHAHEISKEACRIYINIAKNLLSGMKIEDALKNISVSKTYERIKILKDMPAEKIKSTGYVVDTLEASLWSLINTDNYRDCIIKCINLGNDTDTIAAVAGGLAGIMYGIENIPCEWIEKLQNKKLIDECLF